MHILPFIPALACATGFGIGSVVAQESPAFLSAEFMSPSEVRLRMKTVADSSYRLEYSENLVQWSTLNSFRGAASSESIDTSLPVRRERYYRIQQLAEANPFLGDHLATESGDVVIRPVNHASFVFRWNGKTVYNDPVGGASLYASFPRPDLILVSHGHGDHFDSATLNGVRVAETLIIAPAAVSSNLSPALRAQTIPLANGATTNVHGIQVEAVPAYNARHPKGAGNGYVVTVGGRRLYISGDTEDVAEMRALRNIEVAFVCMNLPFTMSVDRAASAVREFRPRMVYPYHHRDSDVNAFKRLVGTDAGVEVRLRAWY